MPYYHRRRRKNVRIATKTEANDNYTFASQATDKLTVYVQALLELFSRSNSILAGQSVQCVTSTETPIACTDGKTVYFNTDLLKQALQGADKNKINVSASVSRLAHIRGVNLHELAHIKYSPRKGQLPWNEVDRLAKEIGSDPNKYHLSTTIPVHRAWNLLEDLRIESLFSTQFRNTIPYFNRTVTEVLLNDPKAQPEFFHLWLYGRRYVPADIRKQARDLFIKHTKITDKDLELWEGLIDDYRSFIFPRDGRKIAPLLLQFLELWNKYFPNTSFPETGTGSDGAGGHGERREGSTPSAEEQRNAQQRREETEEDWEDAEDVDGEDGDSDSDDEDDSDDDADGEDSDDDRPEDSDDTNVGGGDDTSSGDNDSDSGDNGLTGTDGGSSESDSGKQDGDKSNDSSNGTKGKSSSSGEGNANQGGDSNGNSKLLKSLEDSLATTAEQVYDDIADTLRQVLYRAERLKVDALFKNTEQPTTFLPPSPKFKAVSNALNTALRQLRSDNDSMWERGVPTGRLNIGLAINSEAQDSDLDVFDRWNDSGDDAPKVEVVILLDQSGSMSGRIPTTQSSGYYTTIAEASAAMWSLKLACQQNEVPCTVIGYSDSEQTRILYRSDDRVNQQVGIFEAKRSTEPSVALKIAHSILSASDATNKILVSISDGEWGVSLGDIQTVQAINSLGVETIFVALPCNYGESYIRDANGNFVTGADGQPALKVTPNFAVTLETGVFVGYDSLNKPVYSPPNYAHSVCLKVANPAELAKRIGRAIVTASR